MDRFEDLADVPVPDQWDDITERARTAEPAPTERRPRNLPLALAGTAVVLAVGLVAFIAGRDHGDSTVTADHPSTTTDESIADGTHPSDEPVVVCPDGGLVASTVPTGASSATALTDEVGEGRQTRSWVSGSFQHELLVPGLDYIDFVGERTEQVEEPPGILLFHLAQTRFKGPSGLAGPCESYELTIAGGSEEQRVEKLLQVARGFDFDASFGVTDCGELTNGALQVTSGPTAMAAVHDLAVADIPLVPRGLGDPVPGMTKRPDGRCEVAVATTGGLRPFATISGRDGLYGLDVVRGFAPSGFAGDTGTVLLEVAASVQIQDRRFSVAVDYWCDDCAEATMTIHYPDDELTARASTTGPGTFTGELDHPSVPGSFGWITIVWSSSSGEGRGIWTTNFSSGDFAAG